MRSANLDQRNVQIRIDEPSIDKSSIDEPSTVDL